MSSTRAMAAAAAVLTTAIQPLTGWRGRSRTTSAAPSRTARGRSAWTASGIRLPARDQGFGSLASDPRRRYRALKRDFLGAVGAHGPSQLQLLVATWAEFTELGCAVRTEPVLRIDRLAAAR